MDHLAIMDKSLESIPKILSGEKTVESRWYLSRKAPWDKVQKGDRIYFKDAAEPVSAKAVVKSVKQFSNLQPQKAREIIKKYADKLGLENTQNSYQNYKNKKYCILIHLTNPVTVKPFSIDKSGHGISSAWLCVKNINDIKKN